MNEFYTRNKFELNYTQEIDEILAARCADISLSLGKTAMKFARIDRVPRYVDGEHSFMLGLVAPELVMALELPLDAGLVAQYANVHDLIELKTGDVATFLLTQEQITNKEQIEQAAINEMLRELPPYTAQLLLRYESQTDAEARFVRAVDKLLPVVVDIIGEGERVMVEDYEVASIAELEACHESLHARLEEKFGQEFPELMLAHQILSELFETKFKAAL